MGIFTQKQKPYAPPPSPNVPEPTLLGQTRTAEAAPAVGRRTAVAIDLPGQPGTYLDSEFAPKINAFVQYAREAGHDIQLSSGYRTQAEQDELRRSGKGKMPAEKSLHSAGLAVDVNNFDNLSASEKLAIREAAERAGLSWGGTFGDDRHFFIDPIPGQDRTQLIADFADEVRRLRSRQ
jgi:hypothetical protein